MRHRRTPLKIMIMTALVVGVPAPAWAFSVTFSWKGIPACSSVSPAFQISAVPKGTAALAFSLHDQDAPDFQHGGSSVAYAGKNQVPRGAISYTGPCPPPGTSHHYVWTVEARGAGGERLGSAQAKGVFP